TFSRTKTVKGSLIPINSTDKILKDGDYLIGGAQNQPDYDVRIGSTDAYSQAVSYLFDLGEDSYQFVFRSSSVDAGQRIRYRKVGTNSWTNVPVTYDPYSNNTGTATFLTPVVLT